LEATSSQRDLDRELAGWTGEYPEAWIPKEGETLVGTVLQYGIGQGTFGPVRTAIIEKDDGERLSVWLSSTVLLSEFDRAKPRPGERVGLKYGGKHPTKGYKRFCLLVDRGKEDLPSFSPLGGEPGDDPTSDGPFASAGEASPTPYADATVKR
jgi:hypothetical protein